MEDSEQIIKIEITWIDDQEAVHIFNFDEMTFPTVEWAERMLWEQLKSLDYILSNDENNHLSACMLIDEDLQVYKPEAPFRIEVPMGHVKKTLRFEKPKEDNKTYLVLVYLGIYPYQVEVEADYNFGDILVFINEQEAEDFILSIDVGNLQQQFSWGIVEFDQNLVPQGKHVMVYKPE